MTEIARFFDGVGYTESQFSEVLARLGTDGVVVGRANRLVPTLAGSNVNIGTGEAFVQGFWYQNDAVKAVAIPANASATPRVDWIVLYLDRTANTLVAQLHQGVVGSGAPTLTQVVGGTWEYPLAQVSTASGVSTLTDVRGYSNSIMTAAGDLVLGGALGLPTKLVRGANNTLLGVDGSGVVGWQTDPKVSSLNVGTSFIPAAGQVLAAARVASGAFGYRVLSAYPISSAGSALITLNTQYNPGMCLFGVTAQYGDYGACRLYLIERHASSSSYMPITQIAIAESHAGILTWNLTAQNTSTGVVQISNTTPSGTAPTVTFSAFELPLLNSGM